MALMLVSIFFLVNVSSSALPRSHILPIQITKETSKPLSFFQRESLARSLALFLSRSLQLCIHTHVHTHTHTPDDDRSEKDHEDLPISITYQRPPHPHRHLSIGNFQRRTVVAIAVLCFRA